jgi:hypothetical protein
MSFSTKAVEFRISVSLVAYEFLLHMSSELQVNLSEWGPEMQVYFHLLSFSAVENQSFGSSVMTLQISELSNWIRRANQFNSTRNSYPIFHYNYIPL